MFMKKTLRDWLLALFVLLVLAGLLQLFTPASSGNPMTIHGHIVRITSQPSQPWGIITDWSWKTPFGGRHFQINNLPEKFQREDLHVKMQYLEYDVVGVGRWATVISPVMISNI